MKTHRLSLTLKLALLLTLLGGQAQAITYTYNYDTAGRLANINYGSGASIDYTYDNNGNLLQRQSQGSTGTNICGSPYPLPPNQWRQIGLPCDPGNNNTVEALFDDDDLGVYGKDWVLFTYDPAIDDYVKLGFNGINGILEQGKGYWIIQLSSSVKNLDMPTDSTLTPVIQSANCPAGKDCFEIPLASQDSEEEEWNMIGFPFTVVKQLGDVRLVTNTTDCVVGCTLEVASNEDLAHNIFFTFNGLSYTQITTDGNLSPWTGYWAATLSAAHAVAPLILLIPEP